MEATEGRLEAAGAGMGAPLVPVDKNRRGAGPEATALPWAVLAPGDEAPPPPPRGLLHPRAPPRLLGGGERPHPRFPGQPLVLRLPASAAPAPVCRLTDTGDYLVHVGRLCGPFTVLLRATLDPEALEETPVDYPPYRAEILAALSTLGIPAETV